MTDTGILKIHGKDYETVPYRVSKFRETHPDMTLETVIYSLDSECVIMRAIIADDSGRVIATGHAEEFRNASQINKTSALENCETSAIGRALAAFGMGGTQFASANEVQNAVHQQQPGNGPIPFPEGHYDNPSSIKQAMKNAVTAFAKAASMADLDALFEGAQKKIWPQVEKYPPLMEWWTGRKGDNLMLGILGNYNKRKAELEAEEADDLPAILAEMHRNTSTAALKAWLEEPSTLERLEALDGERGDKFQKEYDTLEGQLTELQQQRGAFAAG